MSIEDMYAKSVGGEGSLVHRTEILRLLRPTQVRLCAMCLDPLAEAHDGSG